MTTREPVSPDKYIYRCMHISIYIILYTTASSHLRFFGLFEKKGTLMLQLRQISV